MPRCKTGPRPTAIRCPDTRCSPPPSSPTAGRVVTAAAATARSSEPPRTVSEARYGRPMSHPTKTQLKQLAETLVVEPGSRLNLRKRDPGDRLGWVKEEAVAA